MSASLWTRTSRTRTRRFRTSRRCARAAGFTGDTAQSPLADIHVHQVTSAGLCPEAGREVHSETMAMKRRILLGRCMSPIGCPLSTTTWASSPSTTVISRSTSRTSQTRPRSSSMPSFQHVDGAPPTPVAKNAQRVLSSGHWRTTTSPSGSTAPTQASGFKTSEPCWPIARHNRPPRDQRNSRGAAAMRGPALLRRLHGRARHEPPETDGDSAARESPRSTSRTFRGSSSAATGCRWCGISCWRYELRQQARRQLGRLVSGDESDAPQITTAEDWHVGFAPGPGDDPADAPRRSPDYCLNVGITWPGLVALELEERVPTLSFKSFGAFIEGAAQRAESIGDTGAELARELGRRFRKRARSRPGDAARHQPGGDGGLQRQVVCLVRRRRCLSRALAPRRDGVDGDAGWPTGADCQDPLRIHRRNQHAHHSRRPGALSPRSPAALRAMALRLAGRRGELRGPRTATTRPERQLCGLQEGRDRRRGLRRLPAVEQRQDRSRTAGRKDLRAMAQRRSARLVTGHGQPCGRDLARTAERFRVRGCRWFGRSEGDRLSRRRAHTPRQPAGSTGRGSGACPAAATTRTG